MKTFLYIIAFSLVYIVLTSIGPASIIYGCYVGYPKGRFDMFCLSSDNSFKQYSKDKELLTLYNQGTFRGVRDSSDSVAYLSNFKYQVLRMDDPYYRKFDDYIPRPPSFFDDLDAFAKRTGFGRSYINVYNGDGDHSTKYEQTSAYNKLLAIKLGN